MAMSIKLNLVLSAALVLGSASAALAASKHPTRHVDRTTVQRHVVAPGNYAYPGSFGYQGYNGSGGYNAYAAAADAYAAGYFRSPGAAYDYYNTVPRGESYIYIQDKFYRDSN